LLPRGLRFSSLCALSDRLLDENSSDLAIDFFAGSGTTAHAVMNLNRADDGDRKYLLVEIGEHFNKVIIPNTFANYGLTEG
jgi:adenine-specific DNA-methyltransferase